MQVAVSGGFGHGVPGGGILLALGWFAGFALVGLVIFWWRTRAWNSWARSRERAAALTPATSV
jgi:hypothetical protein